MVVEFLSMSSFPLKKKKKAPDMLRDKSFLEAGLTNQFLGNLCPSK
jgi:hypothetical protein